MRMDLVVMLALAGCPGTDAPPQCIDVVTTCNPLYPPEFDNVYANTLTSACGSTAIGCHSAAGRAGGMSFEDPATAHAALLAGRVEPGDASCSEMIVRAGSPGADYQMPPKPASAVDASELCALVQWVENGALP
jgi:hypothetical protein